MSQKSMTITVAGDDAEILAELAHMTGRSYDELVAEAIHCAYVERWRIKPRERELTPEEQKANFLKLMEELDKLPVHNPDDGFSSADHDKILYGGNW